MKAYKASQYAEIAFNLNDGSTGDVDADSTPTYRVYEGSNASSPNDTVLATGNCSKKDDSNTVGAYVARPEIDGNYDVGKYYDVRVSAVVDGNTWSAFVGSFIVLADNVWDSLAGGSDKLEIDLAQWKGSVPANLADTDKVSASVQHVATDAIDADALAADAVNEIQSGLATTNHVQEVEDKVDGLNDLSAAEVNAEADQAIVDFFGADWATAVGVITAAIDAVVSMNNGTEDITWGKIKKLLHDAAAGNTSGFGTASIEIDKSNNTGDPRITASVDPDGNRTTTVDYT